MILFDVAQGLKVTCLPGVSSAGQDDGGGGGLGKAGHDDGGGGGLGRAGGGGDGGGVL